MTTPRPRYALPWPPDADPPSPEVGALDSVQSALWVGTCGRCSGEGVVALEDLLPPGAPGDDDLITCPTCLGSGVGGTTAARRLFDPSS